MCTDYDIDLAFGQAFQRLRDFFAGSESREFGDLYWPISKTISKGVSTI